MPIVEITWFEGRTVDQKREIARRVTDTLVEVVSCPPEAVSIVFNDRPRHDLAKAGKLACDD
ncbi:MAG: tautomerase family protein [Deltaproteobacteria bacterium]|nr:tautomerase family protein [Deltaproteobacteria bacterium]